MLLSVAVGAGQGIGDVQRVVMVGAQLLQTGVVQLLQALAGRACLPALHQIPAPRTHHLPTPAGGQTGGLDDQGVREQHLPGRPMLRPPLVAGVGGGQEGFGIAHRVLVLGRGELVSQDRLGQLVQLHAAVPHPAQTMLADRPQHRASRQTRCQGFGQRCGGLVVGEVAGADGDRERVGCQQRQRRQQQPRARMLRCQAVGTQADLRGQRHRIPGRPALGQHRHGVRGQFAPQIRSRQAAAQQRAGLGESEGQVVQSLGESVGLGLVQDTVVRTQQGAGFGAGEDIHAQRGREYLPVGVARGDHHMAGATGQETGQGFGLFGVVEDQQPPRPRS
nr:hypothetical protein [Streptomyces sp. TLI_55]